MIRCFMADQVKTNLAGKWIVEKAENVEAYLKELGCCVFERKCIARHKGSMCIGVEGNVITIEMQCSSRREVLTFELDKPYEIRAGKPSKATSTWEDGALVTRMTRLDGTKHQLIERRREGEFLIMTMTTNGVVCRKTLKRMDDT